MSSLLSGTGQGAGGWQLIQTTSGRGTARSIVQGAHASIPTAPFPAPLPHNRWARETEGWTWYSWVSFYIPFFGWIRTYNWRAWLIVSAGRSQLGTWSCQ